METCPYCNSVQSVLMGNVYCSNHSRTPMHALETGSLFIGTRQLEETAEHISRLSIRYSLKGEQYYRIGRHDHTINPQKYVIINQGQRYKTAFDTNEDHEMILVAFKPGFAETVLHHLVTPLDQLLDRPFESPGQPVHFFEHTYPADPLMVKYFMQLRQIMDLSPRVRQAADLDQLHTGMMEQMLLAHRKTLQHIGKIKGLVKTSTKAELYRRLCLARDYMDAHLTRHVSVGEVARQASLSEHHFKRSFTRLFGTSPHRYHVTQRLRKALHMARQQYGTTDICLATGFENPSSFIRLFRQTYGFTPGQAALYLAHHTPHNNP